MVTTPDDVVILVVNFIVFLVHKIHCCGYERPDALYDQVTDADVVVYGLVHSHTRQPRIGLHAYTAHMDVICFLKGGPMERRIDIKDAGIYLLIQNRLHGYFDNLFTCLINLPTGMVYAEHILIILISKKKVLQRDEK